MNILIALLVTTTMAAVDYCHARYTKALIGNRSVFAALWSVGQWGAASVGFVVAVKISMWYLPFEALGLFIGTLLGASRFSRHDDIQRRESDQVPSMPAIRSSSEEPRDKRITGFTPSLSGRCGDK